MLRGLTCWPARTRARCVTDRLNAHFWARHGAVHYFINPFGHRHVTSCRLRQYRCHYRSMVLRRNQNIRIYLVYSRENATHVLQQGFLSSNHRAVIHL